MTGVDSTIIYYHNLKNLFQNQKSTAQYEKNLSRLMERERRQITKLILKEELYRTDNRYYLIFQKARSEIDD